MNLEECMKKAGYAGPVLYSHQQSGIEFMYEARYLSDPITHGIILAHYTGAGKTLEAFTMIALGKYQSKERGKPNNCCLVVAPNETVMSQWLEKAHEYYPSMKVGTYKARYKARDNVIVVGEEEQVDMSIEAIDELDVLILYKDVLKTLYKVLYKEKLEVSNDGETLKRICEDEIFREIQSPTSIRESLLEDWKECWPYFKIDLDDEDVPIQFIATKKKEFEGMHLLFTYPWDSIYIDEAHGPSTMRKRQTNRNEYQTVLFAFPCRYKYCLTATPVKYNDEDLWVLLRLVNVPGLPSFKTMKKLHLSQNNNNNNSRQGKWIRAALEKFMHAVRQKEHVVLEKKKKKKKKKRKMSSMLLGVINNIVKEKEQVVAEQIVAGSKRKADDISFDFDNGSRLDDLKQKTSSICREMDMLERRKKMKMKELQSVKKQIIVERKRVKAEKKLMTFGINKPLFIVRETKKEESSNIVYKRIDCEMDFNTPEERQVYERVDRAEKSVANVHRLFATISPETLYTKPEYTEGIELPQISTKVGALLYIVLNYVVPNGDKAIVMSKWVKPLHVVQEALDEFGIKSEMFTGKVLSEDRYVIQKRLNNEKDTMVCLLASMDVSSIGLNLHGANHVIFLHANYIMNDVTQCEGRVRRPGQKKKDVYYWHLYIKNTIEQKVLATSKTKGKESKGHVKSVTMFV